MNQLILKGLGKKKVRSILNRWIKDQINRALESNHTIIFDNAIWLDQYVPELENSETEPMAYETLFQFIGNKI